MDDSALSDGVSQAMFDGALAGLVATAPMTAVMLLLHRLLPEHEQYPLEPLRITRRVAERVGLGEAAGEGGDALAATASKLIVKQRLLRAGLPTPPWITSNGACHGWGNFGSGERFDNPQSAIENPQFIVKSVYEHASFQMDDKAVFEPLSLEAVSDTVRQRELESARPFFAEQFIAGREFNLSLWGNESEVLPPATSRVERSNTG